MNIENGSCFLLNVQTPFPAPQARGHGPLCDHTFVLTEMQRLLAGLWVAQNNELNRIESHLTLGGKVEETLVLDADYSEDFLLKASMLLVHHKVITEDNMNQKLTEDIKTRALMDAHTNSFELMRASCPNGPRVYLGIGRKIVSETVTRACYAIQDKPFPYGAH